MALYGGGAQRPLPPSGSPIAGIGNLTHECIKRAYCELNALSRPTTILKQNPYIWYAIKKTTGTLHMIDESCQTADCQTLDHTSTVGVARKGFFILRKVFGKGVVVWDWLEFCFVEGEGIADVSVGSR